jgi:hypothetical protein
VLDPVGTVLSGIPTEPKASHALQCNYVVSARNPPMTPDAADSELQRRAALQHRRPPKIAASTMITSAGASPNASTPKPLKLRCWRGAMNNPATPPPSAPQTAQARLANISASSGIPLSA